MEINPHKEYIPKGLKESDIRVVEEACEIPEGVVALPIRYETPYHPQEAFELELQPHLRILNLESFNQYCYYKAAKCYLPNLMASIVNKSYLD